MIRLVCPICEGLCDKARTTLVIRSFGFMRIVPSRESGVERAVASPIRAEQGMPIVQIIPDSNLICGKCGAESPTDNWKYEVTCDGCGASLFKRAVKDPSKLVDKHVCKDTLSLYCDRCWERSNKEYCPDCRFSETCLTYNNR